jgi:hypothetical protein
MVVVMLSGTVVAQTSVIDTDFGRRDGLLVVKGERLSGSLPAGWRDNSEWAPVWVSYEPMEREGRAFVRADVTRVDTGRCQIVHDLPRATEETFYRLRLVTRAPTGTAVDIIVREGPAPYRTLWSTRPNLRGGWQDQTIDFRMDKFDGDIGLYFLVEGAGQLDLARVELTAMTRRGLAADLNERYAHLRGKNLVRISRFPLGLQSGWAIGSEQSDGDEVIIQSDPAVTGPSGVAALKVSAADTMELFTAPFAAPLAGEPHVASLYLRGRGKGTLGVLGDMKQLAETPFDISGEKWTRVAVPFSPVLLGHYHAVRIRGSGEFWIDGLQVETGSEPRPYASQMAHEVSMAVDSPARVQFDDEAAAVRFLVTPPPPANARIRAKVTNVYGDSAEATIEQDKASAGEIRYDVLAGRPLGTHRIEAWAENEVGEPISTVNELVVHRLHRPRYWGVDAPLSPFGVHTNSTTRHILMAKAAGVNWTRLHDAGTEYIGWRYLEPEKGKWTFRDEPLKRYRRHGMKVLASFSTSPNWASYMDKPRNGYFDQFWQPRDLADFANYVRVVAARYDGVIDAYDIWNEPWFPQWWAVRFDEARPGDRGYRHSEHPATDFAKLCRTAYDAAKSVDPGITIVGVNTTNYPKDDQAYGGTNWTRDVIAAGGLEACDVAGYHQYLSAVTGWPGDEVSKGVSDAVGQVRKVAPDKRIWMTEGNAIRDAIGNGMYLHTVLGRNDEDVLHTCDMLVRHIVSMLSQGVEKEFLYSMHSHTHFGRPDTWATLVCEDGMLHPSGAAHSAMAWQLEDTRFVKIVPVAEGVNAYVFEARDGSRSVAVLLRDAKPREYPLPAGDGQAPLEFTDIFGNPLAGGAPLGSTPVYVATAAPAAELERAIRK